MPVKKARTSIIDAIYPGFTAHSDRGKASNARGKVYERAVANRLKPLFKKAARTYGQSREGHELPDVGGTPFWIECANGSTNAIHAKLRQGLVATSKSSSEEYGGAPVAVFSHHAKAGLHMVTMEAGQFVDLLRKLYGKR